ncbi:MAG: hypothetical protein KJ601_02480, partial [Nanoarchaeota archaeon]|nr:hypothetical protein [Nanoarchaeota archaeon]
MELSDVSYFGLGNVPIGIGAMLKGWDITAAEYRDPETLKVVDFRAMTAACLHDCFHCFTEKRRKTLSLEDIKAGLDPFASG